VLAAGAPEVAGKLLAHVPRLEPVLLQILNAVNAGGAQMRVRAMGPVGASGDDHHQ